jgi:hypothetical protein
MSIELFTEVALARDLPEQDLRQGDVATVVEHLPSTEASGGEQGYVLEIFNAIGQSLRTVAVPASAVEPLRAGEVLAVRRLAQES